MTAAKDKLQDYRMPSHLLRRFILAFGLSQLLVLALCRPLYAALPLPVAILGHFSLAGVAGFQGGRWTFRSPLTFREALHVIRNEFG